MSKIDVAISALNHNAPDEEVNRLCMFAFGWEEDKGLVAPWFRGDDYDQCEQRCEPFSFCTSLDAIVAEIPTGWTYRIFSENNSASVFGPEADPWCGGMSTTVNRALLLALLRAMEEQHD